MPWECFKSSFLHLEHLGLSLDISRMNLVEKDFAALEGPMAQAFEAMDALEGGAIANPDEDRMVGHYWLRASELAPEAEIREAIEQTLDKIKRFSAAVHSGEICGDGGVFRNVLVIGIGGSALGPQFVADALGQGNADKLKPYFFDNTDPDGIDRTLRALEGLLGETLAVVISKSGGTPETRNGMLEAEAAWEAAGLKFGKHAVAVTGEGSKLDVYAQKAGWLERFPMWDWVGGRTSELAAVGLLPAALQGIDIEGLLAGARAMDEATRIKELRCNPAALLALCWHKATGGRGKKDMVVLPYKDRLMLFSRYLQQLVMESLGKEKNLRGEVVHQGIAVYGNKGSTDQHAYVQQLREGVNNFFVTFIEVLRDREGGGIEVEPGVTSGDYLQGFYLGTREALSENGRGSLTLTIECVDAFRVGALIALYERAVGFYASLVGINAYHQPGVEAGKKAAAGILDLLGKVRAHLRAHPGDTFTAEQLAAALGVPERTEIVFKLLERLAANASTGVVKTGSPEGPCEAGYGCLQ